MATACCTRRYKSFPRFALKAKRELVQIVVQALAGHCALVGTHAPAMAAHSKTTASRAPENIHSKTTGRVALE
jgi:hypothetical protein